MIRKPSAVFVLLLTVACSEAATPTDLEDRPGDNNDGAVTVSSVHLDGPERPLQVGETTVLAAVALDAGGNLVQGTTFAWTSSQQGVAMVTGNGQVTALAQGETTIAATAGGKTGSLIVEVVSPTIPDGNRGSIAYVKGDQLRLIEPDGTGDRLVWTLPDSRFDISALAWRPDGDEIAFASNHEMGVSRYERDIFAIAPAGIGLRKITNPPLHEDLSAYPRGTVTVRVENFTFDGGPYIVYVEGAPEPQSIVLGAGGAATVTFTDVADLGPSIPQPAVVISGIYRWLNAETAADVQAGTSVHAGTITLTANPIEHFGADAPFWRSDGTAVGFMLMPTCLLERVAPSSAPTFEYDPLIDPDVWGGICTLDWAPDPAIADQLLLADMSEYVDNGSTHVYRVPEGSSSRPEPLITFDDYVRVTDLRWLPDGSGFVVARQDGLLDEDVNLYHFDFETRALTKLTDFTGEFVRFFSIAPDGESIVFERVSGGEFHDLATLPADLWVVDRDGGNARLLVAGGRAPAW